MLVVFILLASIVSGVIAQSQQADEPVAAVALSPKAQQAQSYVNGGLRYEHAEGVVKDYELAHSAYCAAAKLDSAEGYLRLAWMYANGKGVTRNDSIAGTLFKKAGNLGSETGQRLAEMIRAQTDEVPKCLSNINLSVASKFGGPAQPGLSNLPALPNLPKIQIFSQLNSLERTTFAKSVSILAKDFKLDPRLVMAVMRAESNYDPLARSPKGAQGLMQLIPETAERFAVKDITDPVDNIRGGMTYLKWLLSLFRGDVVLSLAAYNSGEKTVERFGGVPPYPETMAYVQRIRSIYPVDFHAFDERAASYRNDKKKLTPQKLK
jgi:Transglycosylase SLT domain